MRNPLRKPLSVMLCIAFILTAFYGCNTQSAPPKPTVPDNGSVGTAGYEKPQFSEEDFPRMDGSTATIPLIEAVTCVLLDKPRSEVSVTVSKTSGAYVALANNEADILFVYDGGDETRVQLGADEIFETVPIGKDALVFLVNKDNPVDDLSTEQVRMIFSGEYTNWSQVGGSDEPIRAYQRGVGSGSQALMDKLVMPGLAMGDPARIPVIAGMAELVEAVADFAGGPTGIGYNVFYYVTEMRGNDYVKILSVDGVTPTYETIRDGKYPFVSDFYSVIRADEPSDSPARILHEWMLTAEAQNLIASENYVALHADPSAITPFVDRRFSHYPEGEAPEYFAGIDPFMFKQRNDYGKLYFYLGANRFVVDDYPAYTSTYFGICTAEGKIVTEPVFSTPLLLTDSKGNQAYFCYRSDRMPVTVNVDDNEVKVYPAYLFAVDGSWVRELDAAMPFIGFTGVVNEFRNADVLAVMSGGKWGAVSMTGKTVVAFEHDSFKDVYPTFDDGHDGYGSFCVTADRYLMPANGQLYSSTDFDLYDGGGSFLASGLRGRTYSMAGKYILTLEEDGDGVLTVRTYTMDGKLIASLSPDSLGDDHYNNATVFGDEVLVYGENGFMVCDRELNVEHVFFYGAEGSFAVDRDHFRRGLNVFYSIDYESGLIRTYLPNGTRLVTWYDPEAR